jgi:hypothetical protein
MEAVPALELQRMPAVGGLMMIKTSDAEFTNPELALRYGPA